MEDVNPSENPTLRVVRRPTRYVIARHVFNTDHRRRLHPNHFNIDHWHSNFNSNTDSWALCSCHMGLKGGIRIELIVAPWLTGYPCNTDHWHSNTNNNTVSRPLGFTRELGLLDDVNPSAILALRGVRRSFDKMFHHTSCFWHRS